MTLAIIIRPLARHEFDGAMDWYLQAGAGLADRFINAVQDVFDEITVHPNGIRLLRETCGKPR